MTVLKIPAGETFIMDTEKFVLDNGDKVVAQTTRRNYCSNYSNNSGVI